MNNFTVQALTQPLLMKKSIDISLRLSGRELSSMSHGKSSMKSTIPTTHFSTLSCLASIIQMLSQSRSKKSLSWLDMSLQITRTLLKVITQRPNLTVLWILNVQRTIWSPLRTNMEELLLKIAFWRWLNRSWALITTTFLRLIRYWYMLTKILLISQCLEISNDETEYKH